MRALRFIATVVTLVTFAPYPSAAQDEASSSEVTRDDVREFLDPTELINRFEYGLEMTLHDP